jgi:hypothetical protein
MKEIRHLARRIAGAGMSGGGVRMDPAHTRAGDA